MNKFKSIIFVGTAVMGAYLLGWIFSVGLMWVIQKLVNAIFGTNFNFNVFLGGVLFYIIWLLLRK